MLNNPWVKDHCVSTPQRSQGLAGACKGLRSWSSHWAAKPMLRPLRISAPRSKACIWLDIPEATCGERVLQRFGHRTLPPEDKSLEASSLRMSFSFRLNSMKPHHLHCETYNIWWNTVVYTVICCNIWWNTLPSDTLSTRSSVALQNALSLRWRRGRFWRGDKPGDIGVNWGKSKNPTSRYF